MKNQNLSFQKKDVKNQINYNKLLIKFSSHRYLNQFDSGPIKYHILFLSSLVFLLLFTMIDRKGCHLYFKINDIHFGKK
jgi:hypothetical protein